MKAFLKQLARVPVLGRGLMIPYRFLDGLQYVKDPVRHFVSWLFTSREFTNYTYALTETNTRYLAAFVAQIAAISHQEAMGYIDELNQDASLRQHIRHAIQASSEQQFADLDVRYGRRLGWYAFARAMKPRVIVETGVDKGLGACVLTAALQKNAQEGHPGYYYGTDINPRAGYLLSGDYARYGEILYGDSIDSLNSLDDTIDLFINDSDHTSDYEAREYEAIEGKLSNGALVISDNACSTEELLHFARRSNRAFLYFQEQPEKHWFPGAGIGVAYPRDA